MPLAMRYTPAGPQSPHATPGRIDSTPFKALPGERLAPLDRHVPVAWDVSEEECEQIWSAISGSVRDDVQGRPPGPFPRDIWVFFAVRFCPLQVCTANSRFDHCCDCVFVTVSFVLRLCVCDSVLWQTVVALMQTCRSLNALLSHDAVWRDLYVARFGALSPDDVLRSRCASWRALLQHRIVTGFQCLFPPIERGKIDFNPFQQPLLSVTHCIITCRHRGCSRRRGGRWMF